MVTSDSEISGQINWPEFSEVLNLGFRFNRLSLIFFKSRSSHQVQVRANMTCSELQLDADLSDSTSENFHWNTKAPS